MASGGLGGTWDESSLVESFLVSGGGDDVNFGEAGDGETGGLPDGGCGAGSTLILYRRCQEVREKVDAINAYMCTSSTEGADLVPYLLVDDRARGDFFNVAPI